MTGGSPKKRKKQNANIIAEVALEEDAFGESSSDHEPEIEYEYVDRDDEVRSTTSTTKATKTWNCVPREKSGQLPL